MKLLQKQQTPLLRVGSLLLIGLSLSIGWGIRGNFGHQYGAAFAGCVAIIPLCVLSGREDWRKKLLYFAFFGAIGWGFGATVSYMQVIAYTDSGHFATQWYGYGCLFLIGFLWASLGVAGTALAAVAEKDALADFFKPVLFVFAAWLLLDLIEDPIASLLEPAANFDSNWSRHKNPLYWFDANYLPAFFTLLAAGVYDLQERREKNGWLLPVYGIGGALAGWGVQSLLHAIGWDVSLAHALTYPLGDPTYINPATGQPAYEASNLLNNWPQWFGDYPQAIGWLIGAVAGLTFYFLRYGKFRKGSSLIVYMAGGWLVSFLVFPVLGSLLFASHGGIRMTPPRSDDWSGIVGVFAGTMLWFRRHKYLSAATASVIGGAVGGLGFAGIAWLRQVLMVPGNPRILVARGLNPGNPEYERIVSTWANWQHQNWHSFLEQSYGFVNGIALAVGMAFLATRLPLQKEKPAVSGPGSGSGSRNWTLGVAAIFTLLVIPYINLVKNVDTWSDQSKPEIWKRVVTAADGTKETLPALWDVPYIGRLPGFGFLHLTPEWWFDITWIFLAIVFIILLNRHFRKPLAIIPRGWIGKGQLIFLLLLWIMVIGNFERALTGWGPERLLTEWVITVNAMIVSVLVLILPGDPEEEWPVQAVDSFKMLYRKAWKMTLVAVVVSSTFFLFTNRLFYQYPPYEQLDFKHIQTRFGREANWRSKPILKNGDHK